MLIYSFQIYQWHASMLKQLGMWLQNFIWLGADQPAEVVYDAPVHLVIDMI